MNEMQQERPFLKSSHSPYGDPKTCVEVAPFRKSPYSSDPDFAQCVEVGMFELR